MTKKKQPDDHLEIVRHKILDTARALFVQQGYKKTTIRQIVQYSGVLTGSIYYLFRNKEDIFQALILELMKSCIDIIENHCARESAGFKYAALCMVELRAVEANELVRDTFYEGYTSKIMFEKMVEHQAAMMQELFGSRYTEQEYYTKALLIKGAMRACVMVFYFQHPLDAAACRQELLRVMLLLFEVPDEEQQEIMQRIQRMDDYWLEIGNTLRDGLVG